MYHLLLKRYNDEKIEIFENIYITFNFGGKMLFRKAKNLFLLFMITDSIHLNAEQILVSNFSESEFQRVERVFVNNTGHIDHVVNFICDNVLSQSQSKGSFLDIGAGPATITSRLAKFFKSTTVIDANQAFESIYREQGFITYMGNFQDIQLDTKYDLILCSHVLYHVPHPEWGAFLKKLYGSLRSDGKGLILMVAPKGKWHELRSSINPNYSNSDKVEKALKEQGISYDLIPVQSVFRVENYEDFRALVRLFTIDDCYLPDEYQSLSDNERKLIDQRIEDYIATCKQSDGSYEFMDEDMYISLSAKTPLY